MVGRRECDASKLRSRSDVDLAETFASVELKSKWDEQAKRLAPFGVTAEAEGVNPGDRRAISYLIGRMRPTSVLEVGTHIGASTLHIAAAMHADGADRGTAAKLVSVDIADVNDPVSKPWLQFGSKHSPREMIEQLDLTSMVEFVPSPSIEFLANTDRKFDFVFLDGNHAAEVVYQEVPLALNALSKDGVILLHDYFPNLRPLWADGGVKPGPFLAIERLKADGANVVAIPLGELPWPTKLGTNETSLALVLRDR